MFAYSFVAGFITGNENIIKLPSIDAPEIHEIKSAILSIAPRTDFRDKIDAKELSSACDVRILWGSDETIDKIRAYPLTGRKIDLSFGDKYSVSVISKIGDPKNLAHRFFRDTYSMDQNACSSPHAIFWVGCDQALVSEFLAELGKLARSNYKPNPVSYVDSQIRLCEDAIRGEKIKEVNGGYVRICAQVKKQIDDLRGSCGYFYEIELKSVSDIVSYVSSKWQTVTYEGIDCGLLRDEILKAGKSGVDRIVPIGRALDWSFTWDGIDLIERLTRVITCD